jgi:hypothetical protein
VGPRDVGPRRRTTGTLERMNLAFRRRTCPSDSLELGPSRWPRL